MTAKDLILIKIAVSLLHGEFDGVPDMEAVLHEMDEMVSRLDAKAPVTGS